MKWEYRTEPCDAWKSFWMMWGRIDEQLLTGRLNELADEGWELVTVSETSYGRPPKEPPRWS